MSPCKNCTLRFTACWDHCPKDESGGYGYKAWLADKHKEKETEREWRRQMREDFLREERNYNKRYDFNRKKWW